MPRNHWDDNETQVLFDNYSERGIAGCADILDRSPLAIMRKANSLGLTKKRAEDLTGRKFGKWTVVGPSAKRSGSNTCWNCICECGNEAEVQRPSLLHGKSTQCQECANSINYYGNIPLFVMTLIINSASKRGIPMNLTIEYLDELYIAQGKRCALSNLPIGFFDFRENEILSRKGSTASLDRIDSSIGYVPGNVQWVHRDINLMKNSLSEARFLYLCHLIVECSLHGHSHGTIPDDLSGDTLLPPGKARGRRIDVGVDLWQFAPVALEALL